MSLAMILGSKAASYVVGSGMGSSLGSGSSFMGMFGGSIGAGGSGGASNKGGIGSFLGGMGGDIFNVGFEKILAGGISSITGIFAGKEQSKAEIESFKMQQKVFEQQIALNNSIGELNKANVDLEGEKMKAKSFDYLEKSTSQAQAKYSRNANNLATVSNNKMEGSVGASITTASASEAFEAGNRYKKNVEEIEMENYYKKLGITSETNAKNIGVYQNQSQYSSKAAIDNAKTQGGITSDLLGGIGAIGGEYLGGKAMDGLKGLLGHNKQSSGSSALGGEGSFGNTSLDLEFFGGF